MTADDEPTDYGIGHHLDLHGSCAGPLARTEVGDVVTLSVGKVTVLFLVLYRSHSQDLS